MVEDGGGGGVLIAVGDGAVRAKAYEGEGPRERLMRLGASALTDSELLAVLFGTGSRGNPVGSLAESVVRARGGLRSLAQSDPRELCAIPGLGPARAAQVLAALELGSRAQRTRDSRPRLVTPEQIFLHLAPAMVLQRREIFHVLCLNARNVLLADVRVAEGTMETCPVDPREVFRVALASKCTAIVVAHNHPSGDPHPSTMDVALTRQLMRAANLLGIKLLDHIVVGDGRYASLLESGVLGRLEAEVESCAEGDGSWSSR